MTTLTDPRAAMTAAPDAVIEQDIAALHAAHAGGLFHYAVSLLHQPEDARDALQEVFLRYFMERKCGGQIDHPRAWMYRVLRNYLLDWLDRAVTRHEVQGPDADEYPDAGGDPEALVYRAQLAAHLREVLSDREFNCLLLRAEGLSYVEMAEVLNLKVGTVGVYLTRVQKKLREAAEGNRRFHAGAAQALTFLCHEAATC